MKNSDVNTVTQEWDSENKKKKVNSVAWVFELFLL